MFSLSIIIPTYKRPAILRQCLEHLQNQTIAKDLEVIVVSDGPDEEVRRVVGGQWSHLRPPKADYGGQAVVSVQYFEIPKSQQGVARNEGVKHASSEFVMFIGDDIFLEHDACEKHLARLRSNWQLAIGSQPTATSHKLTAVLGFTTWDPACGITPVMRWLEASGWQFGYSSLATFAHAAIPQDIQHRYTYTSHISLPIEIARQFPFRTDLTMYGWEDTEWGMRLRDAGVKLFYEPEARALHHHHIELADSLKRMETLGRSAREIAKKIPKFDRVPRGMKLLAYQILALLPTIEGRHRKAFLCGLWSTEGKASW